ncbi:hypothetical protein MGG_17564 [Pyricularia oryzae 70-15]|uniref:Uncharacterized protein n=1 Tax=Pyricularia oryzae (strain 70-15 / ATCC MYA-4617 / FGSC 8958) TaxID=242507 RepID=G4NFK1_PYRO7|nr:uncharacterized protein MGG_17564 [Pyricularia oryzae 70-15]EHA46808.1 hypothetical protein MGG_17564 [Pyricularia oryzae 70-15]
MFEIRAPPDLHLESRPGSASHAEPGIRQKARLTPDSNASLQRAVNCNFSLLFSSV